MIGYRFFLPPELLQPVRSRATGDYAMVSHYLCHIVIAYWR